MDATGNVVVLKHAVDHEIWKMRNYLPNKLNLDVIIAYVYSELVGMLAEASKPKSFLKLNDYTCSVLIKGCIAKGNE
jgi:hypothetical protein